MKKMITLAFCLYVMPGLFAQQAQRYDHTSPWYLGFNVGAAWNSTDVKNETNVGWGFTLGRSFNTQPEALFSFDLRMRYLMGTWYGQDYDTTSLVNYNPDYMPDNLQDYKDNPGYSVNNFSAQNHHLGLELVLHANRLRQRTGWDPYIFAGANLVWNQTFSDLENLDSSFGFPGQYVYDPTFLNDAVINSTLDGLYETPMNPGSINSDYNLEFMPSIGIGLAYYFGPRFALGIEHKSTFTRKDDWDGFENAEPGLWGRSNDIYHYTNGFLRFHLRGRRTNNSTTTNNNTVTNCPDPIIELQRPNNSGTTVQDQIYAFRARVENINSIQNVRVRVNGVESNNFFYSTTTRMLEGSLVLNQGPNQIQVVATNSCGTDSETIAINYEACRAPIVRFTEPSQTNTNVDQSAFRVRATIANGGNISYTINGAASSNFFYTQNTGSFESSVNLIQGTNTIAITSTNECGSDTETIIITYTDCEDPRINFLAGNGSVMNVTTPSASVRATILGIENTNAIGFRLNGANRPFNYNAGSGQLDANVALSPGANQIQVTVGNECGTDVETLTINYTPCSSPQVTILTPVRSGTVNSNGAQLIEASVTNAANVNQIQMLVNGVQVAGGSYNPVTRIYSNTAALNAGTNIIQIVVNNSCGTDSETTNVVYQVNCPLPMISLASTINNTHQSVLPIQYVVQNITSASQVQLTLNGAAVQGGFFNNQTNVFSATLALSEGANTITINATNNCGADSETIVVYYTQPCDEPIIAMVNPLGNQLSVSNSQFEVQAILQNVSNASQVQLSVNGSVDVSGSYSSITQLYRNSINLQPGSNTVIMTVNNGCSIKTEVFVINYSPCLQPIVSITSPTTGNTQNENVLVTATVLNVDNASAIELVVNGNVYTGTYNTTTGVFQSNVPLNSGANIIQVIATNECGSTTESTTLNYAPCAPPNVQLITRNRGITQNQIATISALVTGVSGANEIAATHNGAALQGSYNAATNTYSVTVTLTNGLNTITITASNECGTDTQSTTINYTEPCDAPQVSITSPANGASAASSTVQFSASVVNVNSQNDLQLIVNGNPQAGNWNNATGVFSSTINLQQGANIIQVIATNACGSSSETITVLYRPCLEPTVQLLAPMAGTTQSASATLQALVMNVVSANDISLTVNGTPVSGTYNTSTKMFTATLGYTDGVNNIVVSANNNCGNDSKSVSVTYNEPCLTPQVSIASPANGTQVSSNTVQLAATVLNIANANGIQLLVNGTAQSGTYNASTGAFTAAVSLQNGNNIIEMVVTNACGNETETINVFFRPCITPSIQITSPLQTTTNNPMVTFQAVVSGVNAANQITVTLNGSPVNGMFKTTTSTFTAPMNLSSGNNTIEITATNDCGTDVQIRTIIYDEPCLLPQIAFTTPTNGLETETNTVQVSAVVQNVANGNDIQLAVNGVQQSGVYNAATGAYTATVTLHQGQNAITIAAVNDCGNRTETVNVSYQPCLPPTVEIIDPSNGSSASEVVLIKATVLGVSSASNIQVTANGAGITTGTYDATSGLFQVSVTLNSGSNTITIQAANDCGVDGESLMIKYDEPCEEPKLVIVSPVDGVETAGASIDLVAQVSNITSAAQIQVTVNGTIVSGGSFDANSGVYNTTIPLERSINTIRVTATNDCGRVVRRVAVSKETEPTMLICAMNPANPEERIEMEIPVSSWPEYQAQGATQGPCPTGNGGTGVINTNGGGQGSTQQGGSTGGTQTGVDTGGSGGGIIPIVGGGSNNSGGGTPGSSEPTTGGGNDNGGGNNGTGGRPGMDNNSDSGTVKSQQAAQEAAAKKAAQEAAAKKAAQEAAAKKAAQEAAAKKAAQEAAAKKAAQEAAAKKAAQEAAAKKAAQEAAAKKAAQEAAAKKAAQEAAAKKAAQEAAAKKAAQKAAAKKAAQEAAAKKAAQEAAAKKAAREAAAKRAAQEAAGKKAAQEAAAKKAAQEAAAKKKAAEEKKEKNQELGLRLLRRKKRKAAAIANQKPK